MLQSLKNFFTENIGLKFIALILALALWFYMVDELNKGSEEEKQLLSSVLPQEGMVAKKLLIRPIFVGSTKRGYALSSEKVVIIPDYCIVVGTKNLLGKIKFAYTMPIDLSGTSRTLVKSVPLNPIAPGIYMEETLVQVTAPIEKVN